jgi:hypothetical protein
MSLVQFWGGFPRAGNYRKLGEHKVNLAMRRRVGIIVLFATFSKQTCFMFPGSLKRPSYALVIQNDRIGTDFRTLKVLYSTLIGI